ncbi:MAG TPA: long-chain fatty acid--CoA ligase [Vicinamibacterales bacterium]
MSTPSPYAARPWTRHWDYWVRSNLSYPGRSLYDVLAISAVERPDKPATQFLGAQLTYSELKRLADSLATSLAKMGIAKGDRVGVMLPNCPQYIIASFAILRLGAIVVNINPSYTPREALIIATDSSVRTVITLDALAPLIKGIQPQTAITSVIVTSLAEYAGAAAAAPKIDGTTALADLLAPVTAAGVPRVKIESSDLAVLQYTGGTTGTPKGAMLTHGNVWANIVQTESWTNPAYILAGTEKYLVVIPYFHIYAFSVCMMVGLRIGALQIIHPKYEPDAVLASIRDFRPTYFPAVPTVFVSLLNHPRVLEHGLEHVRLFNSGGAPCPVEVMEEFERRIGRPLNEGYGLSETSPVTHSTPQLAERKLGTIGLPFPDTDVKIVDVETGRQEIPVGEIGEVCIAGPQVMQGYWNKPEESAHVLRPDAAGRIWFYTGDIGSMDEDGYFSIVQRKKDMLIVDGYNVYPSDVESVLYAHPAVRLAAVIGIPDKYHGEVAKACIALKPGTAVTADEIVAHCRTSLTEYKVPRQIEIRDNLPMSAVGKILYRVLRDEHAAAAQKS